MTYQCLLRDGMVKGIKTNQMKRKLEMLVLDIINGKVRIPWVNPKWITLKNKGSVMLIHYSRKSVIPPELKLKTWWLKEKRKIIPNSVPVAICQQGGDRFGLYTIEQTIPIRGILSRVPNHSGMVYSDYNKTTY